MESENLWPWSTEAASSPSGSTPLYRVAERPNVPVNDPRFRKLVQGIEYSRWLLLSYNLVLLGLVLLFAVEHWGRLLLDAHRRRRRRTDKSRPSANHEGPTSSSSSSTLEGTATPSTTKRKLGYEDEERRLLLAPTSIKKHAAPGILGTVCHHIKAWAMYQPRPIPWIHKQLPSNATTLAVLVLYGVNAFYLFFKTPLSIPLLFVFADRCSILFVANLPLLYLFAAKNQPISWLTGRSYESLNIFHRRLGELVCLLALLHGLGMFGVWYTLLKPVGFGLSRFLLSKVIMPGIGALIAYELIYLTSLASFRQRCYETFLVLHVGLQAAALVLLWLHHHRARIYVGIALLIFLVDRIVFRLFIKSTTMRADIGILEDGQTVLVSTNWDLPNSAGPLQRLLRRNVSRGWQPTDHAFITVPNMSHKNLTQAHPFTIASPAPPPPDSFQPGDQSRHAWLSFLIRAQEGFSRDLILHAQTHSSIRVRLDGPYGSQRPVHLLQRSRLAVIVAGGSGVAVAFPLLWALLNGRPSPPDEESQHADGPQHVCFLWIVHSRPQLSWLSKQRLDELRERGAHILVPEPTAEVGRPDVAGIVRDWVATYDDGPGGRIGVVVSGPDGMNRAARNTCAWLAKDGRRIDVEVEKFGW
ncbi:ferric reductase transmembrane component [Phyllosticta citribraziliensis]|uniref:Ferric reductase transmembrane component n=1 Tax=Phyllosticta citribraziliensis TaxID=989973 RepID=A0ABR1L586_9PEZI